MKRSFEQQESIIEMLTTFADTGITRNTWIGLVDLEYNSCRLDGVAECIKLVNRTTALGYNMPFWHDRWEEWI